MESLDHERFMRRAIALTANCPRLPFGALIVRGDTGEVVADRRAVPLSAGSGVAATDAAGATTASNARRSPSPRDPVRSR
jgi:hypothetical protein